MEARGRLRSLRSLPVAFSEMLCNRCRKLVMWQFRLSTVRFGLMHIGLCWQSFTPPLCASRAKYTETMRFEQDSTTVVSLQSFAWWCQRCCNTLLGQTTFLEIFIYCSSPSFLRTVPFPYSKFFPIEQRWISLFFVSKDCDYLVVSVHSERSRTTEGFPHFVLAAVFVPKMRERLLRRLLSFDKDGPGWLYGQT